MTPTELRSCADDFKETATIIEPFAPMAAAELRWAAGVASVAAGLHEMADRLDRLHTPDKSDDRTPHKKVNHDDHISAH